MMDTQELLRFRHQLRAEVLFPSHTVTVLLIDANNVQTCVSNTSLTSEQVIEGKISVSSKKKREERYKSMKARRLERPCSLQYC